MTIVTLEQRVLVKHGCSVEALLETYVAQGKTSKQIAEELGCGVSNVRRLARKYNVRFHPPVIRPQMMHNPTFLATSINAVNFLSRPWHNKERTKIPAYVDPMMTSQESLYAEKV